MSAQPNGMGSGVMEPTWEFHFHQNEGIFADEFDRPEQE
ncbi:hypothetical protein DFR29_12637 [Tahibacter aquaticus]|uniref:Uncharacterized protein n=1 Tax=Tahibacter aquaticus TaxID=520092 RepID=A0A4R6YJH6_9GAMM|nr:hypothetical protein DFR29_12637 [Tahibacter aquaticus]